MSVLLPLCRIGLVQRQNIVTRLLDRSADIAGAVASLRWLSPVEIQEDVGQPRQEFPAAEQTALAESIAESGIALPLLVRCLPDGTYHLTDGARRLRAARAVGLDLVPCVVSQDSGWLAVRHDQLLANAQRLDLTPLEDAQALYILWLLHHTKSILIPLTIHPILLNQVAFA